MGVSIIVPVFNEATTLPDFLDTTRTLATETIFVDGGSTDGTEEVLRDRGARYLSAPRGRATQMNAGAAGSTGNVLLFLHADTILPPHALGLIEQAVADGAVGGHFDVKLDSRRPLLRVAGRLITWRSRLTGVASGDQAIFVTRAAFDALDGYSPLPLFEDLDLSRRLKRLGAVARLPATVTTSSRRWEQLGVWRTIVRMWALRSLYYCGVDPETLARHYEVAR